MRVVDIDSPLSFFFIESYGRNRIAFGVGYYLHQAQQNNSHLPVECNLGANGQKTETRSQNESSPLGANRGELICEIVVVLRRFLGLIGHPRWSFLAVVARRSCTSWCGFAESVSVCLCPSP